MKRTLKNVTFVLLTLCMAISCLFTGFGCNNSSTQDVGNKMVIKVANYSGGVGIKWLDGVKTRFEAAYANKTYGDKVGVYLDVSNDKSYIGTSIASSIGTDTNDVYFTQEIPYNNMAALGQLFDITELVTERVGDDDKTILSKFSPEHVSGLKYNDKYFAIPHYEVFQGVIYDHGIFTRKNLFFADGLDSADAKYIGTNRFVNGTGDKKSCGPDGIFNTYDDGMPSSVQEFYKLVDKMIIEGVDPFMYAGGHDYYTLMLQAAIYANITGADALRLHLNFGEGVTDGKNEVEIVTGFNGSTPQIDTVTITPENGYLLRQAAGLYYGIEFATNMWKDKKNYAYDRIFSTTSHTDAQREFLCSGIDGQTDYMGMLIEGNYWYNEANDAQTLETLSQVYPETYQLKDPRFMPMPVQYDGRVTEGKGKAPVLVDNYNSYSFVNANVDTKKLDAIYDFLSFCYTDAELEAFTIATNGIARGVNYDVEAAFSKITNKYAKSLVDIRNAAAQAGNVVRWCSDNETYINNMDTFSIQRSLFWRSQVANTAYSLVVTSAQTGITAKEYFTGMRLDQDQWNGMVA